MRLTQNLPVLVLLMEGWQGGEDEAERGDHHEQAGDNSDNLTKLPVNICCAQQTCLGFWSANASQCYTINNRNISIDIAPHIVQKENKNI